MTLFVVSCEQYDKRWYVNATDAEHAKDVMLKHTEDQRWHLDYPDEEKVFDAEKMSIALGEFIEDRDL